MIGLQLMPLGRSRDGRFFEPRVQAEPQRPSSIEGFGNAFLEAVYYRRLILVNNYSIYEVDIKPKGFRTLWFDGFISQSPLDAVRNALKNPEQAQAWAEENYQLAKRYFSFTLLERRLESVLADCLGYQV